MHMQLKISGKAFIFIIIFVGAAFLSFMVSNALASPVNYIYDELNRLKEVDYPDGTVIKYEYDKLGNRRRVETSGNPGNFITATAGANGTISPLGVVEVNYGASQNFTLAPITGYHVATVTGCGGTLSGSTYTTGVITGFCTVSATFAIDTFTVTPSPGSNGSMSPGAPQSVNYGSTTVFTITPNAGYLIASVTGCGGTWSGGSSYTTGAVYAPCTVSATFSASSARIGGTDYNTIQAAYDAAPDGAIILVRDVVPPQSLTATLPKTVTLAGGYNAAFTSRTGVTTLQGIMTISNGKLTVKDLVLAK